MPTIRTDFQKAMRALRAHPLFAIVVVVTLALGVAATATVFSVVDAVLIRPLPYRDADRLVGLWHATPGLGAGREQNAMSDASYLMYRGATNVFDAIAAHAEVDVSVTEPGGKPDRLRALRVTASLFPLLGAQPTYGRAFTAADDAPGASPVVMLAHSYFESHYGTDSTKLGSKLTIDGVSHEVIGVMPDGFNFPDRNVRLYTTLRIDSTKADAGTFRMNGIARLANGVSIEGAESALQPLALATGDRYPGVVTRAMLERIGYRAEVHSLKDDIIGDVRPLLLLAFATVAMVLLSSCANIANLFLARAEREGRDVAVRIALGASFGSLLRRALFETMLLCGAGALTGVLIASAAVRVVVASIPQELPRAAEVQITTTAIAVAFGVSFAAALIFALLPLIRRHRADLAATLRDGNRSITAGRSGSRTRRVLLGAQVALTVALVASAGLMVRTLDRMRQVEPGFSSDSILTFRVALPVTHYASALDASRFHLNAIDRLSEVAGVAKVAAAARIPLTDQSTNVRGIWFDDRALPAGSPPPLHSTVQVSSEYFEVLGIPLEEGRVFERTDHEKQGDAVIVSGAFARNFWPGKSALGRHIRPNQNGDWYTVVGVVGNVRESRLTDPEGQTVYFPMLTLSKGPFNTPRTMTYFLRTNGDPSTFRSAVFETMTNIDTDLPLIEMQTMSDVVDRATARQQFTSALLLAAAGIAMVLSALGIYAVVGYSVHQRVREIGVRIAVGASRMHITRMILREAIAVTATGVVAGLIGGVFVGRAARSLLFDVQEHDPPTLIATTLAIVATVLLSSWIPARRAAAVEPVEALRVE